MSGAERTNQMTTTRDDTQGKYVSLVLRIPEGQLQRVKALAARTRLLQSEYLRDAVRAVVGPVDFEFRHRQAHGDKVSIHVMLPPQLRDQLSLLARTTRLSLGVLFSEGVERVLAKENA